MFTELMPWNETNQWKEWTPGSGWRLKRPGELETMGRVELISTGIRRKAPGEGRHLGGEVRERRGRTLANGPGAAGIGVLCFQSVAVTNAVTGSNLGDGRVYFSLDITNHH